MIVVKPEDLPTSKRPQVGGRNVESVRRNAQLAVLDPGQQTTLQKLAQSLNKGELKVTFEGGKLRVEKADRANRSEHAWIEIGGKTFYMHSKWERNYARYLQWLKRNGQIAEWDYEPRTFDFPEAHGNNSYLPDFLVTENDGRRYYVEIKGYMTRGSKVKMKRFRKYFPEETLVLVDADQYRKLARDLKRLPGWE